jgi:3-oxoadipate enol-lactonase
MPWLACKSSNPLRTGPEDGPASALVNGLTQYLKLWIPFRDALVARGFRVASYDMLGQGQSDKPRLFIEQHEGVEVLRNLIGSLETRPVFVGSISFGGADCLALRHRASWHHRRPGADE